MEDFRIFTVNDTTDSNLEEYNSEIELEKEESNVIFIFKKKVFWSFLSLSSSSTMASLFRKKHHISPRRTDMRFD